MGLVPGVNIVNEFRNGHPVDPPRGKLPCEIGAHLGEVLWQLGEHEEARKTWTEAMRIDPENETLVDTLRRYKFDVQLAK